MDRDSHKEVCEKMKEVIAKRTNLREMSKRESKGESHTYANEED